MVVLGPAGMHHVMSAEPKVHHLARVRTKSTPSYPSQNQKYTILPESEPKVHHLARVSTKSTPSCPSQPSLGNLEDGESLTQPDLVNFGVAVLLELVCIIVSRKHSTATIGVIGIRQ